MSHDLPEGWTDAVLGDFIVELRNGISTRPALEPPGVPILRISAARPGSIALDDIRYLPKSEALLVTFGLRDKDLLFTRYNGSIELLGVCGMVRGLGARSLVYPDKLMRVRLRDVLLPEFVEIFFQSQPARQSIEAIAKSSAGQQGISGSDLKAQKVVLPPLAEQRRIVAKVEELLAEVNRAKARITKVQAILKRFRQSVLDAAFSAEDARSVLPDGWRWEPASSVAAHLPNALTIGPFGSDLKVSDYVGTGVPLIFVRDIRAEQFGGPATRFITRAKANELSSHIVHPGDLLITKMGEPPGDTAAYPTSRPSGVITSDCIKLTPNPDVTSTAFLRYCIRSRAVRDQVAAQSRGVAQQKLSLARFKEIKLPLPPLAAQRRIVNQIEHLFAASNAIEQLVQTALAHALKLPQAILSKAFSGELVPAEAELARLEGRDYEPASVLLQRVKTEAAARMLPKTKVRARKGLRVAH
jgi:type I restriction enzyme, S subunit